MSAFTESLEGKRTIRKPTSQEEASRCGSVVDLPSSRRGRCWSTEHRLRCWRKLKIDERECLMALYELRTYTLYVGKMAEATKLYQELGFPALKKGGHDKKLVGYFQADTGTINQLVHLWKFDDDARDWWQSAPTRCCSPGASICTSTCCSPRRAIGPWRWRWSNSGTVTRHRGTT